MSHAVPQSAPHRREVRSHLIALVLEEDEELRSAVTKALARKGFDVVVAASQEHARLLASSQRFDRVYAGRALSPKAILSAGGADSEIRVKDLNDGTAQVTIDRVVPWTTALALLDAMSLEAQR